MGKYVGNKWLDAAISAIVAFVTALVAASCATALC